MAKKKKTRWEVQTYTLFGGWGNCWSESDSDGKNEGPQTFPTRKAAQAAINEYVAGVRQAIKAGNMDKQSMPDTAELRIVKVTGAYRKNWAKFTGRQNTQA